MSTTLNTLTLILYTSHYNKGYNSCTDGCTTVGCTTVGILVTMLVLILLYVYTLLNFINKEEYERRVVEYGLFFTYSIMFSVLLTYLVAELSSLLKFF